MAIENQRLLQYVLYGLGIVLWFVLWKFLAGTADLVYLFLDRAKPDIPVFQDLRYLAMFVALGLTAFAAEYARRNAAANKFGIEVLSELRKVSWPSWKGRERHDHGGFGGDLRGGPDTFSVRHHLQRLDQHCFLTGRERGRIHVLR